jgi:hypothetical protein
MAVVFRPVTPHTASKSHPDPEPDDDRAARGVQHSGEANQEWTTDQDPDGLG